jgi:predicted transcriptional regulator of viral defense system
LLARYFARIDTSETSLIRHILLLKYVLGFCESIAEGLYLIDELGMGNRDRTTATDFLKFWQVKLGVIMVT